MRKLPFVSVCISALLALPCSHALPAEPKGIDHPDAGELVLIPGGVFLMGSPEADADAELSEKPQHELEIKPFYMGVHEVTYDQFRKFVAESDYRTDAERNETGRGFDSKTKLWRTANSQNNWRNTGYKQTGKHPVVNVSWNDAVAYCRWVSLKHGQRTFRLPTEAEWEYACRADSETIYSWGKSPNDLMSADNVADASLKLSISDSAKINNIRTAAICETWNDGIPFSAPVGSFKKNSFGLYDMHGNVSEWCLDFFDEDQYILGTATPPAIGKYRVFRGGSFVTAARDARAAKRNRHRPTFSWFPVGFRIASNGIAQSQNAPKNVLANGAKPAVPAPNSIEGKTQELIGSLSKAEKVYVLGCLKHGGKPRYLEDIAEDVSILPTGACGRFKYTVKVRQVIDSDEMLVSHGTRADWIWLKGVSSAGVADGNRIGLRKPVFVVAGTKSYVSALQTKRTVKYFVALNTEKANKVIADIMRFATYRQWKDSDGKPLGRGRFLGFTDSQVEVEFWPSTLRRIHIRDLSRKDVTWVRAELRRLNSAKKKK